MDDKHFRSCFVSSWTWIQCGGHQMLQACRRLQHRTFERASSCRVSATHQLESHFRKCQHNLVALATCRYCSDKDGARASTRNYVRIIVIGARWHTLEQHRALCLSLERGDSVLAQTSPRFRGYTRPTSSVHFRAVLPLRSPMREVGRIACVGDDLNLDSEAVGFETSAPRSLRMRDHF